MANIYTITAVFLPFFLFFLCYIWISSDWIYIQNIQMFVPLFPAIIYTSNITQCYHLHIKYYSMPSSTHQILLNAIIYTSNITQCYHLNIKYYSMPSSTHQILLNAIIYTSNITQCHHLHIKYYSMLSSTHQILLNAII